MRGKAHWKRNGQILKIEHPSMISLSKGSKLESQKQQQGALRKLPQILCPGINKKAVVTWQQGGLGGQDNTARATLRLQVTHSPPTPSSLDKTQEELGRAVTYTPNNQKQMSLLELSP